MKKIITLVTFILLSTVASAQFSYIYTPADSIYTNVGGWSLKPMYSQKDSTANPDSYFIKFYHPNIKFVRYQSTTNNGRPSSIVWLTSDGYLRRSPIDSIYINHYYTKTQSDALYYLSANPSGFVSNLSTFSTTNLSEGTNLYFTQSRAR